MHTYCQTMHIILLGLCFLFLEGFDIFNLDSLLVIGFSGSRFAVYVVEVLQGVALFGELLRRLSVYISTDEYNGIQSARACLARICIQTHPHNHSGSGSRFLQITSR